MSHEGDCKDCVQHYTFTSTNRDNTGYKEKPTGQTTSGRDLFPHADTTTEQQQSCTPRTEPIQPVAHLMFSVVPSTVRASAVPWKAVA